MKPQYLSRPITVKNCTIPNRLVMPPMATFKLSENFKITDKVLDYYDQKAKGGYLGLIITEHTYVTKAGIAHPGQLSIVEDADIEGYKKLAEVIHKHGSIAVAQLSHAGRGARTEVTGLDVVAPSAIPDHRRADNPVPRPMTLDEIHALVTEFTDAAVRIQKAGFEGIELHAAHGYLLNQFYSPISNHREDEYGGSLDNRIRLHNEIIRSIRAATGEDFLILVRLGACDYMEGGSTIEDAVYACKAFEAAGADIIDISGGLNGSEIPGRTDPGWFRDVTRAVKEAVSIPVIIVGGILHGAEAEELLASGDADMAGAAKALLRDPDWAMKAMTGIE